MYVQFRTDSASIEPHYQARLVLLATTLKKLPSLRVSLQGYADQRGSNSYNLRLSSKRAAAVYDALVRAGVSPSRITRYANGESKPLSKANDAESLNFERRVVISFSGKEGSK
jgi:outer membrane protein OmpA-like peptidoglycan-associated protein